MSKDGSNSLDWSRIEISTAAQNKVENQGSTSLLVSNASVPLPKSLWFRRDFVSQTEEAQIVQEIEQREFSWEGFDQRRRVQRYSFGEPSEDDDGKEKYSSPPEILVQLGDRLEKCTGHKAHHVVVEEYAVSKWSRSGEYASNHTVTKFEFGSLCSCADDDSSICTCFVAQIPLRKACIQHLNKPRKRQAQCWELESSNHWTDIHMDPGSLLVKTNDCLWNWRSRLTASSECSDSVYILKFYTLCLSQQSKQSSSCTDVFGYVPTKVSSKPLPEESVPSLEDLLTVIITTSPIKSNPSTEVIERAMETFVHGGLDFAFKCRKVIVCDGVRTKDEDGSVVSQKHSNIKQAMRNGIVTKEQREKYKLYKANLRKLCENASESSPFNNAIVEELEERHGYGFALRHALRNCISTRFVCVVQHDRTFMRPTPVQETVTAMWRHPNIKYVGMSMRSNLMYRDMFLGKYGKTYQDEFKDLILRVPELRISRSLYGPNSNSTDNMSYQSEKLRDNIQALAETYRSSLQYTMEQEWGEQHPVQEGRHQLSLTPTLFWFDNIHIAETKHYRDFIFHSSYKMVARGGFVEDKLSPVLKRTVERLGLKEGHSRFGCYLLDDHSGFFFTGHLDGGSFISCEERRMLLAKQKSN